MDEVSDKVPPNINVLRPTVKDRVSDRANSSSVVRIDVNRTVQGIRSSRHICLIHSASDMRCLGHNIPPPWLKVRWMFVSLISRYGATSKHESVTAG